MYRWIRNTHLVLGLSSAAFLLMYGSSAIQMSHPRWFNTKPEVREAVVPVTKESAESARAVARELMSVHDMKGELQQVKDTGGGYSFRIVRPGTIYEVDYSRTESRAKVRANTASFSGMLNRIHHIAGLWHEYSLVNVWGLFIGIVSAGLLLLGATGIYLWFRIHTERVIGTILLTLSLGYSLTLMVLMRAA